MIWKITRFQFALQRMWKKLVQTFLSMKGKELKSGACSAVTPTLFGFKEANKADHQLSGLTGSNWARPASSDSTGLSRAGLYRVYITS